MKRFARIAAVMAGLLLITAGSQVLLANCTQNAAVFSVFQCGYKGYFSPAPAGTTISAAWWQLGYGNKGVANGAGGTALEGTGIGPTGVFSGNDSGQFDIVLSEAKTVLPQFASLIPVGAKCMNYEDSWGAAGVDGCADNPRTTAGGDNDNLINRYFGAYGPGYYSTDYQIDYPMGILLTESSNTKFAVAFVQNKPRGTTQAVRANDIGEGFFDFANLTNGDPSPIDAGRNSIIPWQTIPKQRVDGVTFSNPGDKLNSPRELALSWPAARAVSDGSVRPSGRALSNPGNGVGVLDQGPVIRYVVEGAPVTTATPDPSLLTWTALAETTGSTAAVTVGPDTAIRLRTIFGKKPSASGSLLADARVGKLGDMGYDVVSGLTIIAGPLASERAIEIKALKAKGDVEVSFKTTSELTIQSIDILASGQKGDVVVKTLSPKNGTTGVGASYDAILGSGDLKGAKSIKIRLNGPNVTSDPVSVQ